MSSFALYDYARQAPSKHDAFQDWATREEVARFGVEDETQGVILGKGASIAPHYQERDFRFAVNNNVFCVGGSGSGKTRSFILPNLLNHLPQTYVITDTKGEISKFVVEGFESDGYEVTILDTINLAESAHYNPLQYIKTDEDVLAIAEQLYYSTRSESEEGRSRSKADPFWDEAAQLLFRVLISALLALEQLGTPPASGGQGDAQRQYLCMNNILKLTQLLSFNERYDGENLSPLDYFFQGLKDGGIEHKLFDSSAFSYATEQYDDFRIAAGKTLKSILISLNASISKLRGSELHELFSSDEMHFDRIGTGRRVIILKMSDCDSSKSFLAQIALRQLIQQSFRNADKRPDGRLEHPVQFILDEFPNVGKIKDFPRIISTARSRNMSFLICAQSTSQIKDLYDKEDQIIFDNCDTLLYMGSGSSYDTAEYISKLCGKAHVGTKLVGIERTERTESDDIITPSDLRLLPRTECIALISGCKPFRTTKYDGYEHPNAKTFLKRPDCPVGQE